MNERIAKTFADKSVKKLAAYFVAGDSCVKSNLKVMQEMVAAGVDVIELGMAFSDPVADGPVIQAASNRAIENGANVAATFALVAEFRKKNKETPVILMGYYNHVLNFFKKGEKEFVKFAAASGVDGVIIVDLPFEESGGFKNLCESKGLSFIDLIAPTTPKERVKQIASQASGFVYYIALKGVTGAGNTKSDAKEIGTRVKLIKKHTKIPVMVGFGINDAKTAKEIGAAADGIVIGSAIIEQLQKSVGAMKKFLASIKQAL